MGGQREGGLVHAGTEDEWMSGLQTADTHLLTYDTRALCEVHRFTDVRPHLWGDLRRWLGRGGLRGFEFIRLLFWFGVCPARERPE